MPFNLKSDEEILVRRPGAYAVYLILSGASTLFNAMNRLFC